MILFSSRKLESALARNTLTEWQKAKYGVIPILLNAAVGGTYIVRPLFANTRPSTNMWTSFAASVLGILITFRGFRRCFRINEAIDDSKFLERYAVLGLPVTFKLFFTLIPASLIIIGVCYSTRDRIPFLYNNSRVMFSLLSAFLPLFYYALLQRSFIRFQDLSGKRSKKTH